MESFAGNERVVQRIDVMLLSGKIPHAMIIEGDDGLGKRTLAEYIAKGAVCTGDNHPCGQCKSCHLCDVGSHPDVITVAPDSKQITVDKIRFVRQDAYLKPLMTSKKVYIIEKADSMNGSAQNALLKVLEEPPQDVVFILLVRSASSMLETVISRCITLSLVAPREEQATQWLSEHTNFDYVDIKQAVTGAKGNIGAAKKLLEDKKVNEYAELARALICDIKGASAIEMLKKLKPYEKNRAAVDCILEELMYRISRLLRDSCYTHISEGLSREQLVRLYEITSRLREQASANANTMLLFSNICSEYKAIL